MVVHLPITGFSVQVPSTTTPPLVLSVTRVDSTHADWLFDQPVTVSGTSNQLKINGNLPTGVSVQQGAATVRVPYSTVSAAMPWTLTGSEPTITPTPATGQSGNVV